jgi:hypothetical protein
VHLRTGQRDDRVGVKAKRRTAHRALQAGRRFVVPHETIREPERERVHRARRGDPDVPEADTTRIVLHGGLHAGLDHFERLRVVHDAAQEADRKASGPKLRLRDDLSQVIEVRLEAREGSICERAVHSLDRILTALTTDDDLREHRIVERRDLGAARHPRVAAHAFRESHVREQAGARTESLRGIFGVDADLDGCTRRGAPQRVERRQVARAQPHHPFDQVDPGDFFRHAVLDLQPRVHLEEEELLAIRVVQELHGPGRSIANRSYHVLCRVQQPASHVSTQAGRRRLFDHLLMATLCRAVALAKCEDIACMVAEDLHFEVPRLLDIALEVHAGLAEIGRAKPHDGRIVLHQLTWGTAHAHADAATARRALEDDGIAASLGFDRSVRLAGQQARTRQQRHAFAPRDLARRVLQAERTHLLRRRPEEHDAVPFARLDEFRVLTQEPVSGVNRVGAGRLRGLENRRLIEIAFGRRRWSQQNGRVGLRDVRRVAVGLRVHRDRRHAQRPQRPDDPAGDRAAVRNQNAVEHRGHIAKWRDCEIGEMSGNSRIARVMIRLSDSAIDNNSRILNFAIRISWLGPRSGRGRGSGCTRCRGY